MNGKEGDTMELQTLLSPRQEEKESVESKKEDINSSEGSWCRLYYHYYKLVRNSLELKSNLLFILKSASWMISVINKITLNCTII